MSRRKASTPAPPAKRVAIYTRKSTSQGLDQEFNSLDAQREACEQYVASQAHLGWRLVPERYDDGGFTGANTDRPAFARLLADIDAGQVDVVVVYKVDRLSRSLFDFATVMDRFNRANAAFVSVTQNFSTADAMGRLTLNMLMSFAEFEREMISERTRDKIAASRRKGKWTGGALLLGYDVIDRKLIVNQDEAEVVREVFVLYEQHHSALRVAQELNARSLVTKAYQAKSGNVRGGRAWTKNAVLRVLKSPVYAGLLRCGDELYPAEHEAIVCRDQFDRVQAILADRARETAPHGRNPAYILRGVLRCALCGSAMTPASTGKDRRGREYRYYRCVTRDKAGRKACPARPLPAGAIETFIIEHLREVTRDGALAADVAARLEERVGHQRSLLVAERRALPPTIARLSSEVGSLAQSLAGIQGAARRALERRIDDLGAQLAAREERLAEVEASLTVLEQAEADVRWVAQALADFDKVWEMMTAQNRGRLVRALVREVRVDEHSGQVTAILVDIGAADLEVAEHGHDAGGDGTSLAPDHAAP